MCKKCEQLQRELDVQTKRYEDQYRDRVDAQREVKRLSKQLDWLTEVLSNLSKHFAKGT